MRQRLATRLETVWSVEICSVCCSEKLGRCRRLARASIFHVARPELRQEEGPVPRMLRH